MRGTKIMIPAGILLGGFLVCTSSMFGTAEYAKKEKKALHGLSCQSGNR